MEMSLWGDRIPYYCEGAETPNTMVPYLLKTDKPLPCIIVCAGGAYMLRAEYEAYPVAEFFNSRGFHAVVVEYRVAPNRFPAALADVQRAIRLVRYHADEWQVDKNRIVTCGFSAGGHLAASSILYREMFTGDRPLDEVDNEDYFPNGAILGYPVISVSEDYGHVDSGVFLLGEEKAAKEHKNFNLSFKISDNTPKCFLWHTSNDGGVNVKNSLIFCEKLRDHQIPFELHVFPDGPHGLGLATDRPDISKWPDLAADWVNRQI